MGMIIGGRLHVVHCIRMRSYIIMDTFGEVAISDVAVSTVVLA